MGLFVARRADVRRTTPFPPPAMAIPFPPCEGGKSKVPFSSSGEKAQRNRNDRVAWPSSNSQQPGLWVGLRALGSLADRLAELPDVVLEAWLAQHLQHWLDRPVLCTQGKTHQVVCARLSRLVPRHGLNRWTAYRVFYVLLGAAADWDEIRQVGRMWLDKGAPCARPESLGDLR